MKKNLKTLIIVFSVALNIVFIGSYLYHKSGMNFMSDCHMDHNHLLYEKLSLSRQQLDRFGPSRDRFHVFMIQQGRIIKNRQLKLVDLLAKENSDREQIDAKQKEIRVLQQQMQAKVIDHLLEESKIFTMEQRKKFFALIKGRIERSEGTGPAWMPKTLPKPAEGGRS